MSLDANGHTNGRTEHFAAQELASAQEFSGRVKWFDDYRKYGFITPDRVGPDIFLHARCLENYGLETISEGAKIIFKAILRPKGWHCSSIVSIDELSVAAKSRKPTSALCLNVRQISGPTCMRVKWLDPVKGYGFLECPHEPDVFVHKEVLKSCGIRALYPGQEVMVRYGANESDPQRRLIAVKVEKHMPK